MTIVEQIDFLLQERGMSRRQLAIKAKIPPSSLQSAMERGHNISLDMLEKIANALNVSFNELLPRELRNAYFHGYHEALETERYKAATTDEEKEDAEEDVSLLLFYFNELDEYFQKRAVACVRAIAGYPLIIGQNPEAEEIILNFMGKLNREGKEKAVDSVKIIAGNPDYQKKKDDQ